MPYLLTLAVLFVFLTDDRFEGGLIPRLHASFLQLTRITVQVDCGGLSFNRNVVRELALGTLRALTFLEEFAHDWLRVGTYIRRIVPLIIVTAKIIAMTRTNYKIVPTVIILNASGQYYCCLMYFKAIMDILIIIGVLWMVRRRNEKNDRNIPTGTFCCLITGLNNSASSFSLCSFSFFSA